MKKTIHIIIEVDSPSTSPMEIEGRINDIVNDIKCTVDRIKYDDNAKIITDHNWEPQPCETTLEVVEDTMER